MWRFQATRRNSLNVGRSVAMAWVMAAFVSQVQVKGDSWLPYPDQRVVSPHGRYYAVVKRADGPQFYGEAVPVTLTVVRSGTNSPQPRAARATVEELEGYESENGGQLYRVKRNSDVVVRGGDVTLGEVKLSRPPFQIVVSDCGLGLVGLGVWGPDGAMIDSPNAVIVISARGQVIHEKSLLDLFTKAEISTFRRTAGGLAWVVGGWIDELERVFILVAESSDNSRSIRLVRGVKLDTGEVITVNSLHIMRGLLQLGGPGRNVALEAAIGSDSGHVLFLLHQLVADRCVDECMRYRARIAIQAIEAAEVDGGRRNGEPEKARQKRLPCRNWGR